MRLFLLVFLIISPSLFAQNVITDQGVGMTAQELEQWVKLWTPQMQRAAAIDRGDRIELLSMGLASKKIAAEAENTAPEDDPEAYWRMRFAIRNVQRNYVTQQYMKNLEVPDMAGLAEEQYKTDKKKYAFEPERRMSSHILILCQRGACDVPARKAHADELLAKLDAGADFEALATEYSDDPGSKRKGGKFDKWIRLGEPNVSPPYAGALFELKNIGDYSKVTTSQFGFHIIRLDEIQESYYKSFEEVRQRIIDTMEHEYKKLAAKEFDARYRLSDDAAFDDAVLDEIFAPYKPDEPTERDSVGVSEATPSSEEG